MNDEHSQEEFLLGIPEPADFNEARLDQSHSFPHVKTLEEYHEHSVKAYCNHCKQIGKQTEMSCIEGYMFCKGTSCYILWKNTRQRHKIKWFKRK